MKNRTLWILFLMVVMFPCRASVINLQDAKKIAQKVNAASKVSRSIQDVSFLWDSKQLFPNSRGVGNEPEFFVFGLNNNKGFVIVAGDDSANPVLGYSYDSSMPDVCNLPENFKAWMLEICDAINDARSKSVSGSRVTGGSMMVNVGEEVVLLQTAKWNQYEPYYWQTPMDGDSHSLTGCVPTAYAILMKYYEWPQKGIGQTTEFKLSNNIIIPSRNLEIPYEWNKMLMEYNYNSYSEEEGQAVARLMADVGAVMETIYSKISSPTYLYVGYPINGGWDFYERYYYKSMIDRFDYHPSLYMISKSRVSNWTDKLKQELELKRPVFYSVKNHCLIIDGYTTRDFFHLNWGWGGYANGYYNLNYMLVNGSDYSSSHEAIFNFVPNNGEWIKDELGFIGQGLKGPDKIYPFEEIEVSLNLMNFASTDIKGHIRLVVTDESGEVIDYLTDEIEVNFVSNVKYTNKINTRLMIEPQEGKRIRLLFKADGSENWKVLKAIYATAPWEHLLLNVTEVTPIEDMISFKHDIQYQEVNLYFDEKMDIKVFYKDELIGEKKDCNEYEFSTKNRIGFPFLIRVKKGNEVKEFTFEIKPYNQK